MRRPRVGRETLDDFGLIRRAKDQKRVTRAFEWSHESSESFVEQVVHEGSMGSPVHLTFKGLRVVPRRTAGPQHCKYAFHYDTVVDQTRRSALALIADPTVRRIP